MDSSEYAQSFLPLRSWQHGNFTKSETSDVRREIARLQDGIERAEAILARIESSYLSVF